MDAAKIENRNLHRWALLFLSIYLHCLSFLDVRMCERHSEVV